MLLLKFFYLFRILLSSLLEGRRQDVNSLPQSTEKRGEAESPPPDPHGVDEEVNQEPVADAEGEEDTEVRPLVLRLDVERAHEVDAGGERAVSALGRGIRVNEVPACAIDEVLRIRETSRSRRGVEVGCFLGQAVHGSVVQGGR